MKKILLLLANGFETFEASVFIDVIGWNLEYGDKSTKLYTCGVTDRINSTFNQKFIPDYIAENINVEDFDALAIPGGFETFGFYEDAYADVFLNIIREFHRKGKIIASICVAAFPLAKSGILKGKNATTYNLKNGERQKQLKELGVNVLNQAIVEDSNIITSWNPSTAMDVAFILLERLTDRKNTEKIKWMMGYCSTLKSS